MDGGPSALPAMSYAMMVANTATALAAAERLLRGAASPGGAPVILSRENIESLAGIMRQAHLRSTIDANPRDVRK